MFTTIQNMLMGRLRDKILIGLFFLMIVTGSLLILNQKNNSSAENSNQQPISPDTYIPIGFTLVPIELSNFESIGSIIEEFAIVDLYTHSLTEKKARRVGSGLRLIRAPLNPERFAVLVPDSEAGLILGSDGPLSATIRNRKHTGQGHLDKRIKKVKRKVQYYQDGA